MVCSTRIERRGGLAIFLARSNRLPTRGDEPHYLVMADSLFADHDLDLQDNYQRFGLPIVPHVFVQPRGWMLPAPQDSRRWWRCHLPSAARPWSGSPSRSSQGCSLWLSFDAVVDQAALVVRWVASPDVLFTRVNGPRDSFFPAVLAPWLPSFYTWDFVSYLYNPANVLAFAAIALILAAGARADRTMTSG